jgi:hypothetical protein
VEARNSAILALLAYTLFRGHQLVDGLLAIAGLRVLFDALSEHFLAAAPIAGSWFVGGLFTMNVWHFTTSNVGFYSLFVSLVR